MGRSPVSLEGTRDGQRRGARLAPWPSEALHHSSWGHGGLPWQDQGKWEGRALQLQCRGGQTSMLLGLGQGWAVRGGEGA